MSVEKEPDYRFTLANERTFLAWIRTGVSFLAVGIGLREYARNAAHSADIGVLAVAFILFAALLFGCALLRWRENDAAIRSDLALPRRSWLTFVSGVALVIALTPLVLGAR